VFAGVRGGDPVPAVIKQEAAGAAFKGLHVAQAGDVGAESILLRDPPNVTRITVFASHTRMGFLRQLLIGDERCIL
jgi:hypothetical protein